MTKKQVFGGAFYGTGGVLFAGYIAVVTVASAPGGELIFLPSPVAFILLAGAALSGLTGLLVQLSAVASKPSSKPAPAAARPVATITVPGLSRHGKLQASLNIRDHSHRISWISNGAFVGTLQPGARGGFDAYDEANSRVGWFQTVKEGMAHLERHAP